MISISPDAKQDEKDLFELLRKGNISMREAGQQLGIPPRRVQYIAFKWNDKRIWEWGVCHDLGWFRDYAI